MNRRSRNQKRSSRAHQRGAVFVETLVVFLPTLFFGLVTLQMIELYAGHLVIKHAAWMAARSASVVLSADPAKYGVPVDTFAGKRRDDVTNAARMILAAKSHFDPSSTVVGVEGAKGNGPLTATVRADFRCMARFVNIVCGGRASRRLSAQARHVYFGKNYSYE